LAERCIRCLLSQGTRVHISSWSLRLRFNLFLLDKSRKLPRIQHYVLSYEPLTQSVSNECDRIAQIAEGGVGLVKNSVTTPGTEKTRKCQQLLLFTVRVPTHAQVQVLGTSISRRHGAFGMSTFALSPTV
jgi:hypothetical protein